MNRDTAPENYHPFDGPELFDDTVGPYTLEDIWPNTSEAVRQLREARRGTH